MSNDKIKSVSSHVLPPLPYADNALEPVISANTIDFHYGKHHKGYLPKFPLTISGTQWPACWSMLMPISARFRIFLGTAM